MTPDSEASGLSPSDEAAFNQAISNLSSVRRLTPEEVMREIPRGELARLVDRIGAALFCVINKAGTTVVQDPATHKPFRHNNRKFAEMVAKEHGGVVVTVGEAIRIISDHNKAALK